ncbi:MAG TPA: HPr(Ser) kinase/phosphatase [Candidatus Saccharimonadales bacterium]|nr:HPr(Ser) kinase/phosphatase [Candidatus Saccharimonadales bacterium]
MESRAIHPTIRVRDLLSSGAAHLGFSVIAGSGGLDREITVPRIQKPGLALAGFIEYIHPGRVQILGQSEITFLNDLEPARREAVLTDVAACGVTCMVITKSLEAPPELLQASERHSIPLLKTAEMSSTTIDALTDFLEVRLAPHITMHGVMLDIYGVGVLLLGDSGVGKSECALDLIVRGHRLVADDVVDFHRRAGILNGDGPELTKYHMEVRGLGIINIKHLFGVTSVRERKDLDLIIKLVPWQEGKEYERLGLDENFLEIINVKVPFIEMPVAPGRYLSVLIEVAARMHLLKAQGYAASRELAERIDREMEQGVAPLRGTSGRGSDST